MTKAATTTGWSIAPGLDLRESTGYPEVWVEQRTPPRLAGTAAVTRFRSRWWVPMALLLADALALEAALFGGVLLRALFHPWVPFSLNGRQYLGLALGVLVLPVRHVLDGLYPGYGLGPVERLRRRVCGLSVLLGVLLVWDILIGHLLVPGSQPTHGVLFGTVLFAIIICPVVEDIMRAALIRWKVWGIPVVILGAGRTGELVIQTLKRDPGLGLVPVAVFDDDPSKKGTRVEGVPVRGNLERSQRISSAVRVALVTMPGSGRQRLTSLSERLPFPRVIVVPDLLGLSTVGIAACDLSGILALEVRKNLLVKRNLVIKRVMDYVLGVPLFLLSLPLLGLFAAWIKLASPRGQALFAQERVGLHGQSVRVWKLRTMYPGAEQRLEAHLKRNPEARREWQLNHKLKDDPRILPIVGKLLRKTSLDELPQLWNVLRGNMSLVGPRPLPGYHLNKFNGNGHFLELRHSVLPGITGLWQVSSRGDGDMGIQACDTYYIRNWSVWMDMHLLGRTVSAVLRQKGAY